MKLFAGLTVLLVACGPLVAEEVKGKIVKIDADKGTITLSVENKDRAINVEKGVVIQSPGKKKTLQDVAGGLAGLKTGDEATATVEKKDGKEVATKIVTDAAKKLKVPEGARKVVGVDADKNTITISVDGKEQTLTVEKGASVQIAGKMKKLEDVEGGLKGIKAGDEVTVTTEKKGDKEVVTKIVLVGKKKAK